VFQDVEERRRGKEKEVRGMDGCSFNALPQKQTAKGTRDAHLQLFQLRSLAAVLAFAFPLTLEYRVSVQILFS